MTRHGFHTRPRRTAAAAVALAGALLVTACADSAADAGSDGYGDLTVQLSWLKNTQFSGLYLAIDEGFFADEGFSEVELVSGGSGAASGVTAISSGQSDFGVSGVLQVAPAILEGADVRIIATGQQGSAFNITSLSENPIEEPADMIGKTIAVSDSNILVWEALLAANDIDAADVQQVPFSDTSQLTTGQVDGYLGFTTSGPYALELQGYPATEFLLSDHGIGISGENYVATTDLIENEPEKVKAFLKALIMGWYVAYDDLDAATDIAVNDYGADQNYDWDQQRDAMRVQETLFVTPDTEVDGLLTMSDAVIDANIESLALLGYDISADELFDMSLIDEVYAENPELKER